MGVLVIKKRLADITPPSAPVISAAAGSSTSILVSLTTASTDTGGSGLASYSLEYKASSSGTWLLFNDTLAINSFPNTIGGLSSNTSYDVRCRARDNAGNISVYSNISTATTDADAGWLPFTGPTFINGSASNFDFSSYAPVGATNFQLASGSTPLPSGVALDSNNRRLVYDGAGAVTSVSGVQLQDIPSAQADYNARIGAAGVLWAHRFQNEATDIVGYQGGGSYDSSIQQFVAGGGIIPGDGAFQQNYFANSNWGGASWRWNRCLQPMVGDINQPGLPTRPKVTSSVSVNQANAYVMHPDYQTAHGTPLRTGQFLASEIYLQMWMMISPGRLSNNWAQGKYWLLEINYDSTDPELVFFIQNGSGRRIPQFYTNKGSGFNTMLRNPQESGGGGVSSIAQPNSNYQIPSGPYAGQLAGNVCNLNNGVTNACWVFPEGEWMSWLYHFKPGHQAGSTSSIGDSANNGSRDTQFEAWVATATDIKAGRGYTLIHSKNDYVWHYDDAAVYNAQGALQAYGLNWFCLNHFTGGNQWSIDPINWWHRWDQIICSTQPIACPQWAP